MNGGLPGRHIEAVADRLAVQSDDLAVGVSVQALGEAEETAPELFRVKPDEQAAESIVGGDAVDKSQAKAPLKPLPLNDPEVFHILPAFGPAQDGAEGDDHDV